MLSLSCVAIMHYLAIAVAEDMKINRLEEAKLNTEQDSLLVNTVDDTGGTNIEGGSNIGDSTSVDDSLTIQAAVDESGSASVDTEADSQIGAGATMDSLLSSAMDSMMSRHAADLVLDAVSDAEAHERGKVEHQVNAALLQRQMQESVEALDLDFTTSTKNGQGMQFEPGPDTPELAIKGAPNGPQTWEEVAENAAMLSSTNPYLEAHKAVELAGNQAAKEAMAVSETHQDIWKLMHERQEAAKVVQLSVKRRDSARMKAQKINADWSVFVENLGRLMASYQRDAAKAAIGHAETWVKAIRAADELELKTYDDVTRDSDLYRKASLTLKSRLIDNAGTMDDTVEQAKKSLAQLESMKELAGYVELPPE